MIKILIVDDEPDILEAIELSWIGQDVELLLASSGIQALDMLENGPDVVLTDYKMPNMNGLELVAAIHATHPDLPIVMMTAFPDESLRQEARRQGVRDFVSKPFSVDALLARARAAVAESPNRA